MEIITAILTKSERQKDRLVYQLFDPRLKDAKDFHEIEAEIRLKMLKRLQRILVKIQTLKNLDLRTNRTGFSTWRHPDSDSEAGSINRVDLNISTRSHSISMKSENNESIWITCPKANPLDFDDTDMKGFEVQASYIDNHIYTHDTRTGIAFLELLAAGISSADAYQMTFHQAKIRKNS